jgi:hypothetical protein
MGGTAQRLGQVPMEDKTYDHESGELLCSSFAVQPAHHRAMKLLPIELCRLALVVSCCKPANLEGCSEVGLALDPLLDIINDRREKWIVSLNFDVR